MDRKLGKIIKKASHLDWEKRLHDYHKQVIINRRRYHGIPYEVSEENPNKGRLEILRWGLVWPVAGFVFIIFCAGFLSWYEKMGYGVISQTVFYLLCALPALPPLAIMYMVKQKADALEEIDESLNTRDVVFFWESEVKTVFQMMKSDVNLHMNQLIDEKEDLWVELESLRRLRETKVNLKKQRQLKEQMDTISASIQECMSANMAISKYRDVVGLEIQHLLDEVKEQEILQLKEDHRMGVLRKAQELVSSGHKQVQDWKEERRDLGAQILHLGRCLQSQLLLTSDFVEAQLELDGSSARSE